MTEVDVLGLILNVISYNNELRAVHIYIIYGYT